MGGRAGGREGWRKEIKTCVCVLMRRKAAWKSRTYPSTNERSKMQVLKDEER